VGVPGTNVYFAPAPGLAASPDLSGFESGKRRISVVVENIEGPFDEIAAGFTAEFFSSSGMEFKSRGEFAVNGARAMLFKVLHPDGETSWGKWILIAENGPHTVVANAAFVSGDSEAASDLEAMLKSVFFKRAVQSDPASGALGPRSADIPGGASADVKSPGEAASGDSASSDAVPPGSGIGIKSDDARIPEDGASAPSDGASLGGASAEGSGVSAAASKDVVLEAD
jgi:hypothetical protein